MTAAEQIITIKRLDDVTVATTRRSAVIAQTLQAESRGVVQIAVTHCAEAAELAVAGRMHKCTGALPRILSRERSTAPHGHHWRGFKVQHQLREQSKIH